MKNCSKIEEIGKVICDLDDKIWSKYNPTKPGDTSSRTYSNAYLWLESDIVSILCSGAVSNIERVAQEISLIIHESEYGEEIQTKYINMDKLVEEAGIRIDFENALRYAKKGTDLSLKIRFGLGTKDLCELAKLHKKNKFRRKIEDLLEDCNFHSECYDFSKGIYDKYINVKPAV